jgi:hypothetical protein
MNSKKLFLPVYQQIILIVSLAGLGFFTPAAPRVWILIGGVVIISIIAYAVLALLKKWKDKLSREKHIITGIFFFFVMIIILLFLFSKIPPLD